MCHYRQQLSCGKVMFLHISVILSTGGCIKACTGADTPLGQTPPGQIPPWADTPRGQTPPGQITPSADTPPGQTHPLGSNPPGQTSGQTAPCPVHAGIWSTSRRFAPYWNAFLFEHFNMYELSPHKFQTEVSVYEEF